MRWSAYLLSAALVALWIASLAWWPRIPGRIPLHFDFAGTPDRFGERSLGTWLLLPSLATGLCALVGLLTPLWVRWLAERAPQWINIPRKELFVRLAPAQRGAALAPLVVMLRMLALELVALFAAIQYGSLRVATGVAERLEPWPVWLALLVIAGTLAVSIPFASRAVARAAHAS